MNGSIKVIGGVKLQGTVSPIPNKNAIVAALPACLLSEKTLTYKNIPHTADVEKELEILKKLGAIVKEIPTETTRTLEINCKNVNSYEVDKEIGEKFRSSIMFAGPLLARFGKATVPLPGGCTLGFRSIAGHVDALTKAGVKVEVGEDAVVFTSPAKYPKEFQVWQKEASVTATENLLMFLSGIDSKVELVNAACEPHVRQLELFLQDMGAQIEGIGSNVVHIQGSNSLGSAEFVPEPDFVDIGGYIVAASVTKGRIKIKDANHFHIVGGMLNFFSKFNIKILQEGSDLIVDGSQDLNINLKNSSFPMAGPNLPKITPEPWPGFPVDVLPIIPTLASKVPGRILINNWMYETGLDFVRELNQLGADIFIVSPQKVIVNGPISFKGGEVLSPGVIQACKGLFLAAMADPVETTLHGVNILKRRYPDIFEVYRSLGANIEPIEKA